MLFVPAGANSFAAIESNASGRPSASQGTAVTPAVGSKGAWTQAIASLSNDTYGLLICISGNNASAASRNTAVDIGIGAAASEIVVIPDLIAGNACSYAVGGSGLWYFFPVAIPAGTRVAVRAQGTVTTAFRVFIQAFQKPLNPSMIKKAALVEAIGMTVPNGVAVTPGTTAEGAWTLLGTTTQRNWYWQVGAQIPSGDTAHNAGVIHIDLAEGNGTNFNILIESAVLVTTAAEIATIPPITIGCEYPCPAGSSIYARAQHSGTAETLQITAYGAGG